MRLSLVQYFTVSGQTENAAHSPGLASMNAVAALASNDTIAWDFIDWVRRMLGYTSLPS
jgi:hypothetical protein